jgi:Ca-activated chloride channel homolog
MMNWWYTLIFAQQWVLWLLPMVPLFVIYTYYFARKKKSVLKISSLNYLHGTRIPKKVKWRPILYILRTLSLILLLTAFARPQSLSGYKIKYGEGIDILLTIDISTSMDARDEGIGRPSRMETAKIQAMNFVDERPADRMGVVVFSGEAFTICPLTTDHEALKLLIDNIDINGGELEQGTAIGMGLAKAVERINESKAKSKVIILLTDGENGKGTIQPIDAARMAKAFGVRVYTIGLSATQGKVQTPVSQNPDGSLNYEFREVAIDESTLGEIAKTTGGKYFRASDSKNLKRIYGEINSLEKSEIEKTEIEQRKEEFFPFLLVGLIFILLEFSLRYTVFDNLT